MSLQSIRRAIVASGLVIGAVAALSPAAFAGTTAGTVNVSGTVTSTLDMAANATAGAASLPLDSATEQIVKIADLAINTNNNTGYTLTVDSGNLTKAGGANIPFQVAVTDDNTAAATGDFTVASGTGYTNATNAANAAGSNGKDLSIKFTPGGLQDPGAYSATVNLTVADN
jgi:hypothetical protein